MVDSMTDTSLEGRPNLLSGHRESLHGEVLADCNMVSLTPFTKELPADNDTDTHRRKHVVRQGYESALAKVLAIHHLNHGDASIVPQLEGLHQKCPVRFGLDFVDTQFNIGTSTKRLARRMANVDLPPCVFVGSQSSLVSATTSQITNAHGYPQISGSSTSSFLDDDVENEYPLFARTIPSTKDHSKAIIGYLKEFLNVNQLALIYSADAYGYHFLEDLQEAASGLENNDNTHNFEVKGFALLPDMSNLPQAMEFVQSTQFHHVFVAFHGEDWTDHSLMEQALAYGVAGTGSDTTWFFGDDFLANPSDWIFDSDNPLIDAYQGTSLLTANGRGAMTNARYQEFTRQLQALISDNGDKRKSRKAPTNGLATYLETMVTDPGDKELAIQFLDELLEDETFLHPNHLNPSVPYEYEAVILSGLAICNRIGKQQKEEQELDEMAAELHRTRNKAAPSLSTLFLDGQGFQNELVDTTIDGISGRVILDHRTGTRLTNSTYYTIQSLIAEDVKEDDDFSSRGSGDNNGEPTESVQKTRVWKEITAQLEPTIEAIGGDETDGSNTNNHDNNNNNSNTIGGGQHETTLDNYVYNNNGGTGDMLASPPPTAPILDTPRLTPPTSMDANDFVHLVQGLSCACSILAALGFIIWTYRYRNQPIVRASKPLFLYLICCGVILFASAILPFSIVGVSGALEDIDGRMDGTIPEEFASSMTILCSASIWFRVFGFAVIISALFAKTYRVNKIIRGTKIYQTTRGRMLADYLIPLAIMLAINALILCLMTALNPVTYGMTTMESSSTKIEFSYETCIVTSEHRYQYWIPLAGWNISILAFALHQSWSVRKVDLEFSSMFPSESPQIFNALLGSLLMSLVGILIMLVVRDRGNPTTIALVEATIVFLFCMVVLFTVFSTKVKHVWKTTSRSPGNIDAEDSPKQSTTNNTSNDESPPHDGMHVSFSPDSKSKEELLVENDGLRKRNMELEEELILYPTPAGIKNKILKNFFGGLLDTDDNDSFKDEIAPGTSVESGTKQQKQMPQKKFPRAGAASNRVFRFHYKKVFQDISVHPSDLFHTFPPPFRVDSADVEEPPLEDLPMGWIRDYKKCLKTSPSGSNNNSSSGIYRTNESSPGSHGRSSSIYRTTNTNTTNKSSSGSNEYRSYRSSSNLRDTTNKTSSGSNDRSSSINMTTITTNKSSYGSNEYRSYKSSSNPPDTTNKTSFGSNDRSSSINMTTITTNKSSYGSNEYRSYKGSSNLRGSSSISINNSSSMYKTPTTTTATNKSSPESNATTPSDLRPHHYSRRGPEPEDTSAAPLLETKRISPDSSMVPLVGNSPLTPQLRLQQRQNSLQLQSPLEMRLRQDQQPTNSRNMLRNSFDSMMPVGTPSTPGASVADLEPRRNTTRIFRPSFDSMMPVGTPSTPGASLADLEPRRNNSRMLRPSFESMVPLGTPSTPGDSVSDLEPTKTNISRRIFPPHVESRGLDDATPDDDGIPSEIVFFRFDGGGDDEPQGELLPLELSGRFEDDDDVEPQGQPLPQASSSSSPLRRPSIGRDADIPKDPRNPYRHYV